MQERKDPSQVYREAYKESHYQNCSNTYNYYGINSNLTWLNWGIKLYPKSLQISRYVKIQGITLKNEADVELRNKRVAERPPTYNS